MKNYTPEVMTKRFINRVNKNNIAVADWQRQELTVFFNHHDLRTFNQNDIARLTSFIIYLLTDYVTRWHLLLTTKSNSLENLQARYGDEEGLRRYKTRQEQTSANKTSKLTKVDQFILRNQKLINVPINDKIKLELNQILNNLDKLGIKRIYHYDKTICGLINSQVAELYNTLHKLINLKGRGSLDYFTTRYGEKQGATLYHQINSAKRRGLPSTPEYWEARDTLCEDIPVLMNQHQKKAARKSADKTKGTKGHSHRSKEYWINQGYSLEDAIIKVQSVQANTSLINMIAKYGDVEGHNRWLLRQKRWIYSLHKSGMHSGTSKISVSFFNALEETVPNLIYGKPEYVIETKEFIYKVDCYHKPSNTVIEFYGDYWHANPNKYKADSLLKRGKVFRTASEIWEQDKLRQINLENLGYNLIIVWEKDFRQQPNQIVQAAVDKLLTAL